MSQVSLSLVSMAPGALSDLPALTVDRQGKQELRFARKAARQAASRWLLADADALDDACLPGAIRKSAEAMASCGEFAHGQVELQRHSGSGKARFVGVMRCNRAWLCPECTVRQSLKCRAQLNAALKAARSKGYSVAMLTLTAAHKSTDGVAMQMDTFKNAVQRLMQRKEYRALKASVLIGTVVATEVTFGDNGPHLHQHWLVVMECPKSEIAERLEALRSPWQVSLAAFGRSCDAAIGFRVSTGGEVGEYVSKFGLGEEVALGAIKEKPRSGSRTLWQVLNDAVLGCERSRALWLAAAPAFHRRKQLNWSRGLKARLGVDEGAEVELAQSARPGEWELVRAWDGKGRFWACAVHRSAALLLACEAGGDLDAAEYGPTDAERWRSIGAERRRRKFAVAS